jgi:hypothetical protein
MHCNALAERAWNGDAGGVRKIKVKAIGHHLVSFKNVCQPTCELQLRVAPRAMSHHQHAAFCCRILMIDRFYSTFN